MLKKSVETLPPTHFIVLQATFRSPDDVWSTWSAFRKKLHYHLPGMETYAHVEEGINRVPHIHVLARVQCEDLKPIIRECWVAACGHSECSVYCEPIRSGQHSADYIVKHWLIRDKGRLRLAVPWLPGPEWKGRKLFKASKGFLAKPWGELWQEVLSEWFPEGRIEWQAYEEWHPPVRNEPPPPVLGEVC
jgi:hypothetical protein